MPGGKVRLPHGEVVEGTEVPVMESIERWSEVTLGDGAKVRIKLSIISAARSDNHYDGNDNPVYSFDMTPTIVLAEVPPQLKKQKSSGPAN